MTENPPEQRDMASRWEARSRLWGASYRSVLYKGFPDVLNEHLHRWHEHCILSALPATPVPRILDVGCGYGRLSAILARERPQAAVTGVDISPSYVALYRETTGFPAKVASVVSLPDELGDYDFVLCVTVLMYLSPEEIPVALGRLCRALRPGARLLLIEPSRSGMPFQNLFGLVKRRSRPDGGESIDTGGTPFRDGQLDAALRVAGLRLVSKRRMPVASMAILPLYAVARCLPAVIARMLLRAVAVVDRWAARLPLPSIYVAYVADKPPTVR